MQFYCDKNSVKLATLPIQRVGVSEGIGWIDDHRQGPVWKQKLTLLRRAHTGDIIQQHLFEVTFFTRGLWIEVEVNLLLHIISMEIVYRKSFHKKQSFENFFSSLSFMYWFINYFWKLSIFFLSMGKNLIKACTVAVI